MGAYHPIFVHFPVALFALALFCAFFSAIFRRDTLVLKVSLKRYFFYSSHLLVILGTLSLIPTIITGFAATSLYPEESSLIENHRDLALLSLIVSLFHSFLRIKILRKKDQDAGIHAKNRLLLLLIINSILIFWAADDGGLITRKATPFQSCIMMQRNQDIASITPDPQEVKKMNATEFESYLVKKITWKDVQPIFHKYDCTKCHSKGLKDETLSNKWLPRNEDGTPKDWEKSPFYITCLLENRMPIDEKNNPIGMSIKDRLLLLEWVKNGALKK